MPEAFYPVLFDPNDPIGYEQQKHQQNVQRMDLAVKKKFRICDPGRSALEAHKSVYSKTSVHNNVQN